MSTVAQFLLALALFWAGCILLFGILVYLAPLIEDGGGDDYEEHVDQALGLACDDHIDRAFHALTDRLHYGPGEQS